MKRIITIMGGLLVAALVLAGLLAVAGGLPCLKGAEVCAAEASSRINEMDRANRKAEALLGFETLIIPALWLLAAAALLLVGWMHVREWQINTQITAMYNMRRIGMGLMTPYEERAEERAYAIALADAQAGFLSGLTSLSVQQLATPYGDPPALPNPRYSLSALEAGDGDDVPLLPAARPTAPTVARLQASGFTPRPDDFVLAYSASGPITVDLASAGAVAVIGRPRIGKSNFLRWLIWQARQFGDVAVFDPHGSVVPASGVAGRVRHANTAEAADRLAADLHAELQQRLADFAAGRRDFTPLLIVADEAVKLSQQSAAAVNLLGEGVIEGAKVGYYLVLAGQVLPAAVLERVDEGGNKRRIPGTVYRSSFAAQIAFASSAAAAQMIGFDANAARLVAGLQQSDKGLAYVAGVCNPVLAAVPYCDLADLAPSPLVAAPTVARLLKRPETAIETAAPEAETVELPADLLAEAASGEAEADLKRSEAAEAAGLSADAQLVRDVFAGGGKVGDAISAVSPGVKPGGGAAYQQASQRVNAALAELARLAVGA